MGFWPDIRVAAGEIAEFKEGIIRETEKDLLPHLSPEDREIAQRTLEDYLKEGDEALNSESERAELVYLMADWDITLHKIEALAFNLGYL
jgi:hypothetical protein